MKDKYKLPQLQIVENTAVPKGKVYVVPDLTQRVPPMFIDTDLDEYLKTCGIITNVGDKKC
jgi:hypothetical protein